MRWINLKFEFHVSKEMITIFLDQNLSLNFKSSSHTSHVPMTINVDVVLGPGPLQPDPCGEITGRLEGGRV